MITYEFKTVQGEEFRIESPSMPQHYPIIYPLPSLHGESYYMHLPMGPPHMEAITVEVTVVFKVDSKGVTIQFNCTRPIDLIVEKCRLVEGNCYDAVNPSLEMVGVLLHELYTNHSVCFVSIGDTCREYLSANLHGLLMMHSCSYPIIVPYYLIQDSDGFRGRLAFSRNLASSVTFKESDMLTMSKAGKLTGVGPLNDHIQPDPAVPVFDSDDNNQISAKHINDSDLVLLSGYNLSAENKNTFRKLKNEPGFIHTDIAGIFTIIAPERMLTAALREVEFYNAEITADSDDKLLRPVVRAFRHNVDLKDRYMKAYGVSMSEWPSESGRLMELFGVTSEEALIPLLTNLL